MKFPYGLADFYSIRKEGYFYQDRTRFIRTVEERGKQLVFLRPRRFGKSVWISTLANYYDIARADDFPMLFGDLDIGQDPTPLHNQHFISRWDFSKVAVFGEVETIIQVLYDHLNDRIHDFAVRYADWLTKPITVHPTNAISSFESLLSAIAGLPYKLYLLIDEYDNFANEIAMGGARSDAERYEKMVQGDGVLKTVFKNIKAARGEGRMDRVFVIGVSPMLLSDLTSGFNTAIDISLERQIHDLCGFTEPEVVQMAQQVGNNCNFSPEQIAQMVELMRSFYNGYTFRADGNGLLYNPTLTLYFLDKVQLDRKPPQRMLDVNLALDKNKLEYIASRPGGETVILRLMEDGSPLTVGQIHHQFSRNSLLQPDNEHFAALLFYFGLVTLGKPTESGQLSLHIPNPVTRSLHYEKLYEYLPTPSLF